MVAAFDQRHQVGRRSSAQGLEPIEPIRTLVDSGHLLFLIMI